jgi:hypothetical protein
MFTRMAQQTLVKCIPDVACQSCSDQLLHRPSNKSKSSNSIKQRHTVTL